MEINIHVPWQWASIHFFIGGGGEREDVEMGVIEVWLEERGRLRVPTFKIMTSDDQVPEVSGETVYYYMYIPGSESGKYTQVS